MNTKESKAVCLLTLQSWDHLPQLRATSNEAGLAPFVCDPALWITNKERATSLAWDAAPVYLDPQHREDQYAKVATQQTTSEEAAQWEGEGNA